MLYGPFRSILGAAQWDDGAYETTKACSMTAPFYASLDLSIMIFFLIFLPQLLSSLRQV